MTSQTPWILSFTFRIWLSARTLNLNARVQDSIYPHLAITPLNFQFCKSIDSNQIYKPIFPRSILVVCDVWISCYFHLSLQQCCSVLVDNAMLLQNHRIPSDVYAISSKTKQKGSHSATLYHLNAVIITETGNIDTDDGYRACKVTPIPGYSKCSQRLSSAVSSILDLDSDGWYVLSVISDAGIFEYFISMANPWQSPPW